ncbi:MAG: cytochrome P450 [Mycobacterium sp.]|uniref:cytochrome P450 n=1 Tax=Mycobacterium sp. TaxID=1785 RepID=UPI000CBD41CE|nr:cytochrome P450 [Mycobacterium sp.]PJE01831.1 MAG: cytochrome P450 [Mycobacterium sp.]PJE04769.1 MAG: cytochrome P450 [Mycobacterium sp.]
MSKSALDVGVPGGTTAPSARLPPAVLLPKTLQGIGFALSRPWTLRQAARRYGEVFALHIPVFGHTVVVADPELAKPVFMASTDDLVNIQPNLSRVLGAGSVFALDRHEHRSRRKLLAPPFHGKSLSNYERIAEAETCRDAANWPMGQEFPTLEAMNRITLNVILRAVFGAEGTDFDDLRALVPSWVTLSSRLALLPQPSTTFGRHSPWGRLAERRRKIDKVVYRLIETAQADPHLEQRTDVLAVLLRSRYDDGRSMPRSEICDELLTLIGAGHETTAATLAWAFERLRRHPELVAALTAEADGDGRELRQATILEVQRVRTVIDITGRHVATALFGLGEWRIPKGYSILVSISQLHSHAEAFPDPQRFDPYRFLGDRPPSLAWAPFGGGTRRCVGAALANAEMDVVLRTVLRRFVLDSTADPAEKMHSRGVAYTPKRGGRIVLRPRA